MSSFQDLVGTYPIQKVTVSQKADVKQAKAFDWSQSAATEAPQ